MTKIYDYNVAFANKNTISDLKKELKNLIEKSKQLFDDSRVVIVKSGSPLGCHFFSIGYNRYEKKYIVRWQFLDDVNNVKTFKTIRQVLNHVK